MGKQFSDLESSGQIFFYKSQSNVEENKRIKGEERFIIVEEE